MRIYEELFIVRPDATEEEVDALVEQARQTVVNGGGTVDKVDKWGVRKLAYRIGKRDEGFYVLLQFSTERPEPVKELERRFRVSDDIVKFLTVRIDEKLKKIEKRKKEREKRAKRKPQVAAGPARPATPAPGAPGAPAPGAPAPAAPAPGAPTPEPVAAEPPAGKEGE